MDLRALRAAGVTADSVWRDAPLDLAGFRGIQQLRRLGYSAQELVQARCHESPWELKQAGAGGL